MFLKYSGLQSGKVNILYLIQVPPPLHGVSKLNDFIYKSEQINKAYNKQKVELKFSDNLSELSNFSFKKILFFVRVIKNLIFKLISHKPDLVYFTIVPTGVSFYRDLVFVFILKFFRKKIVYHFHGQGVPQFVTSRLNTVLYNWLLKKAYVIHLSKGLLEKEFESLKIKKSKSYFVNNGVDDLNISPVYSKEKVCNILFFSNKFPSKGVFILLDVLAKIKKEGLDFKLIFIGGSAGQDVDDDIKAKIINENLDSNINLLGGIYTDEKYAYFENADIFIHPTLNDALPLVLLDAMQFGLPIISSKIGAIPEIIEDEKNGFLTEPGDIDKITSDLIKLLTDDGMRKEMGIHSRKRFLENYTIGCFEKELKSVFTKIIK